MNFFEETREEFKWLYEKYKLDEIEKSESPREFGNAVIVLKLGNIRMRVIKDRGQIFVDFCSPFQKNKYFDICQLVTFIHRNDKKKGVLYKYPEIGTSQEEQFKNINYILQANMDLIIPLLNDKEVLNNFG
ncbi:MAG: hypothetical protein NT145_01095 [Elusimicrobia bacterium]|nr:hypothetical protein [Elusimicrobiota bacterium]